MSDPQAKAPELSGEELPSDRALEAGASAEERLTTSYEGRFELKGRTLREHTARGVLINSAFQVGLAGVTLSRRVAVAAFLTTTEYGLWGLLVATLLTLSWLKEVGISDKYIQQDEADQELAFQRAFSLELAYSGLIWLAMVIALPVYALVVYDRPEILLPGAVLTLSLLATAFQAPIWIAYRQLRFLRQRVLQSVDPVTTALLTIGFAIAGFGYWALVLGAVLGSVIGAIVAMALCPYRLAFTIDRATVRSYFQFSWPLAVAALSSLLVVQGAVIVGNYTVGLAGIGAIVLASSFTSLADRVDRMIRMTIYPGICAVSEQIPKLREVFEKSNRLGLMWGVPFGVGLALFSNDLVTFVIGERWRPAVPLMQVFGLVIALRQVGFSWSAFMRAVGRTRPIAVSAAIGVLSFAVVTAPSMFILGLEGYMIGMASATVVEMFVRSYYLRGLFPGFRLLPHLARAVLPIAPPAAVILALRVMLDGLERTLLISGAELLLYVVLVGVATYLSERALVREVIGYLRRRDSTTAGAVTGG